MPQHESVVILDVLKIVHFFGGFTEMRFRLERRGLGIVSRAAIDKWVKRGRVPGSWMVALIFLARIDRLRFDPLLFVVKSSLAPRTRKAASLVSI